MAYWLVKSEPSSYSWDQLVADGRTHWNGVRNAQAQNNLRAMKPGDRAFFYHSNEGKEIVGVAEVVKGFYPDPSDQSGKLGMVDVKPVMPVAVKVEKVNPAVAVVHGPAAGVAASLALVCDVVLASEKAFFMLAFTKIALMPDGGASALVAAAVGRIRAMRMALLAERIPAREAFDWGLVTAVYPDDTFDAEVDKVLATLVSGPAVALRKTKEAINAATLTELEGAFEREMVGQSALIRSDDFKEGTLAFQQRRSATFTDT